MNPAFVMVMSAGGASQAQRNTAVRNSASPRTKPRKRVRVSELTRKYRSEASGVDESLLVGDGTTNLPRVEGTTGQADPKHDIQEFLQTSSSRDPHPKSITTPNILSSVDAAAGAAAAAQSAVCTAPIRFSRFPGSWSETVVQASSAVSSAIIDGHDRVRVDVKTPELIADVRSGGKLDDCEKARHARRIELLVESSNSIIKEVFSPHMDAQNPYSFLINPTRAAIFFNSEEDEKIGKRFMDPSLSPIVDAYVLGRDPISKNKANVCLVIAPSNKHGNPSHIEAVEMVHYSNWNHQKLVIMLNPDLFALTSYSDLGGEPRQPCFLSDYVPSYYIDPAAFPSKAATGAILRCFPRKWEMYLLKTQSDMGFRLVAEDLTPPSPEKIRCEFSWRIEKEGKQR